MSSPLAFVMFVSVNNENAGGPGAVQRVIQLQGVKGTSASAPVTPGGPVVAAAAGPNDSLFDSPTTGSATVQLNGVTDAVKQNFKGGKKYLVTIEEVPAS